MSPSSYKSLAVLLGVCLAVACAHSAPTDTETPSTTPMTPEAANTIAEERQPKETTTTTTTTEASSMAVSSAQDQHLQNTSFTCYNKSVGYYADPQASCKVYHFCMIGDYNGQEVYQRISYLCLNGTIFDQQALDCVESAKMLAACADSAKYYDESNSILRKAMIGKVATESETTGSSTATAGAESTTVGAESTTASVESTPASAESTTAAPDASNPSSTDASSTTTTGATTA